VKKLIAGLFVAILMATGLVTVAGTTTADAASPYVGVVQVKPKPVHVHVPAGHKVAVPVNLGKQGAGVTGVPKGEITIKIVKNGHVVKTIKANYKGGKLSVNAGKLPKGKYQINLKYAPKKGSKFKKVNKNIGTVTVG
jgi:hypothetical protein